jgi:hypothetical protein
MAAITLGGAICATAAPADARPHGGYGYYGGGDYGERYEHRRHGDAGAALAAGVVGLALGAALADGGHHHYRSYPSYGYYQPGYYGYDDDYGYGYAPPRTCISDRWVWDPYIGRNVLIRRSYAC